jgi:two-component system, NarL family, response regulator DevR
MVDASDIQHPLRYPSPRSRASRRTTRAESRKSPAPNRGTATEPPQSNLLLIAPDDLRWAAIRLMLDNMPNIEVLADAARMEDAWPRAPLPSPDAVISAPDLGDQQTLPLLQKLRDQWPDLTIIVLFDHQDDRFDRYANLPNASCLCWNDLTTPSLEYGLLAALSGKLRIFTRSVPEKLVRGDADNNTRQDVEALPPRTRRILDGLARGLTEQQIALNERVSLRTVQRAVADLQEFLGAPSLFVLGQQVERVRLLDNLDASQSRIGPGTNVPAN